ncbi:hypothetical protein LCGC14_1191910, partial [marine sediment metagenome]
DLVDHAEASYDGAAGGRPYFVGAVHRYRRCA